MPGPLEPGFGCTSAGVLALILAGVALLPVMRKARRLARERS